MPLKYIGGSDTVVAIVGPVHGFLFMIYLALTFDLSRRLHWPFLRMILVMAAGTIPFLSFWTERKVTRDWARADENNVALAKSPV
jgi:integral membrane protein